MMLGPIFSIEMLTTARRARPFIIRALYAGVLLLALWSAWESTAYLRGATHINLAQSANVASSFFQSFAWLQLLAVMVVGPALTAGTVAAERQRRTIEYLFATDLTNREIVLGKMVAQFLQLSYIVLAGVPVLALAMLMGGIAPEQLLAVLSITLCTLIAVTALAITISVWSPRPRDAITRMYLVLLAVLLVPGLILPPMFYYLNLTGTLQPVLEVCSAINPFSAVMRAISMGLFRQGSNVNWQPVWSLAISQGVATVALTALSIWGLRRVHLREAGKAAVKSGRGGTSRRREIGQYPMVWKELASVRSASKPGWLGRIAMWAIVLPVLGLAGYWALYGERDFLSGMTIVLIDMLTCGGLLMAAGRAAASISGERERDTWLTLMSTPLSAREIASAKLLGSLYSMRGLLALLAVLWVLQMFGNPQLLSAMPFTLLTLLCVGFFYCTVGLCYSLYCRSSTRALGATLGTALFLGGGYLFCCMPLMFGGPGGSEMMALTLCVPFLLAFPSFVALDSPGGGPEFAAGVVAYGSGTIGYLAVGAFLFGALANSFDKANGRISGGPTREASS